MAERHKLKSIGVAAVAAIVVAMLFSATAQPEQIPHIAPSTAPAEILSRNAWTIETYHDGSALVSSSDIFPKPGWVTFSDGNLGGSPGCGSLIGMYHKRDPAIAIQAGALLTGSCLSNRGGKPVDLLEDSRRVTEALSRTHTIASSGARLILQDGDGATMVTLSPRE